MEISNFWVDIENAAGVRQGSGPLKVAFFSAGPVLSASGEFSFEVSAADPNLGALAEKRVAICRYIGTAGTVQVFGGGIIDQIVTTIGEDGSVVVAVSGNDLGRELNYRSVGALNLSGVDAAGVTDAPTEIMALAPAGWSITDGTTLTAVYVGFDGESVLNALTQVGKCAGEHWRVSGRAVQWLGPAGTFEASGVRAVQHVNDAAAIAAVDDIAVISGLKETSAAADLITRVYPRGSGNAKAALTLKHCTDTPPSGYTLDTANNYVKCDAGETAYGRIERWLDFKKLGPLSNKKKDIIAAANMLLKAALEQLRLNGAPQHTYEVSLAHVNQLLFPGTTIHAVYRELLEGAAIYDLDDDFIIVKAENRIDALGLHTTGVTISTIDKPPVSDSTFLASQAQDAKIQSVHQQLGPSVDTLTWRDELDADYPANFRFWLGNEYTAIDRALFRFQIKPLRSTVKTVTGVATTSSGTPHYHKVDTYDSSEGAPVTYQETGLLCWPGASAPINTSEEPAVGGHTHNLTPLISTSYGIFEEVSGNTLALTDLVIKLNGGSDLRSHVTDIGDGWYQLDLTAWGLVDETFRPVQTNNVLTISTAAAKTGRLEALLTIRAVVQAVYYE